jgi:threonylcarbamoyladenosine tRNA methylthiotransferase MtaB
MIFHIFTTGCKSNQWDSYVMAGSLKKEGLAPGSMERADIVVVNGCTVTEKAERDIRRFIQRVRSVNPGAKVVLAGCHAQVYPERAFGSDLVLGQKEKFEIAGLLGVAGCVRESTRDFPLEEAAINGTFRDRTRFFLKIEDGCDRFCTYCIVPYARGKVRSRPSAAIVEDMARLKAKGIQEVVLTGIDIASYRDPASGLSFKRLLVLLESIETPQRIRLSSVDPGCMDEEFVETLETSRKIAHSIHIPLQSGNAGVLKRMGRPYTPPDVRTIVSMLQRRISDIGIGMDVMAGFPGEDDEAFLETYRFIESLDIYYLHVFPYSDRKGTKAFLMEDKVPESIKKQRVRKLKELDGRKREAFRRRFLGRHVSIIPEGKLYKGKYMRGYTDNYLPVCIPFQKNLENNLITVRIESMEGDILIGEY